MVDFRKLRSSRVQSAPTDPIEIFRRLPKPTGINDLYASQAEVLSEWYTRRNERDLVIKLHTGGGKTLVGLLIAQSILNEKHEPVVYLSPTDQLVKQTLRKAEEYSIPAVAYEKNSDFPEEFLNGKRVLICVYQALFNGISRFGAPASQRQPLSAGALIFDDAHVSFSTIRDSFTIRVEKEKDADGFEFLTNLFRNDFRSLGKLGTFDDVVSGADHGILEVPYWSWQSKSNQVIEFLRKKQESFLFSWPFLRDAFDYCHALISKNSFVVTPIFPLVDLIPTFAECRQRIFMSATIGDDSSIVRTFDADYKSIAQPITSKSLAGVSERMILAPELMSLRVRDIPQMLRSLANWVAKRKDLGTVILVSSRYAAESWKEVATFAETTEKVTEYVEALQNEKSRGPFVFANRYDGIDLPGQSCRLLIMSGLPKGANEYDLHLANTFSGGTVLNSTIAQRIEQGIGRGARGAGDYCVVIVTGRDLMAWLGKAGNTKFLTSSTRAQLEIGREVSKNVVTKKDFSETIMSCLNRNRDWIEYHAETLAELVEPEKINIRALKQAAVERKALRLWRDGYFEKAIGKLKEFCQEDKEIDPKSKGWLLQFAARIACYWDRKDLSQEFQENAFANNRNLMRPQVLPAYVPLTKPGKQAEMIVEKLDSFKYRRGYLAEFDEVASHLVPEASSNQFEEALKNLGMMLGFSAERPEKENDSESGPDVLWLLNDRLALIIEAKSRKKPKNAFTKEQHGQLLVSSEWCKKAYPGYECIRVSVQASTVATKKSVAGETKVLTYEKLNELLADTRDLLKQLCDSVSSRDELIIRCEQIINKTNLRPNALIGHYLLPFQVQA